MSSATDTIRAMLDERGVEWTEPSNKARSHTTYWTAGVLSCGAVEFTDDVVCIAATAQDLTPEQAIEATLGRGECRMAHRVFDVDVDVWKCLECGMYCSVTQDAEGGQHAPRYCPNCGRRCVG